MDTEPLDIREAMAPKSDQLNADDLIAGDITAQIARVHVRKATGQKGEQLVDVHLDGHRHPWRPCKSMMRVLADQWGTDGRAWVGRWVQLYRDPGVRFGGDEVGGIRIRALSHIAKPATLALTITRGQRAPYRVNVLVPPTKPREYDAWSAAVRANLRLDPEAVAEWIQASRSIDIRAAGRDVLGPLYQGLDGGADLAAFRASPFGGAA